MREAPALDEESAMNDNPTSDRSDEGLLGGAMGDAAFGERQNETDQGVPVGAADVQADIDRASGNDGEGGNDGDEESDEDFLAEGKREESSDQGLPVGAADAEQDLRRAGERHGA
jgi:hypothetical protein